MNVEDMSVAIWEQLGEPNDLVPGTLDTNGNLTYSSGSTGGSKLLGWINRAVSKILSWKTKQGRIIRFRDLHERVFFQGFKESGKAGSTTRSKTIALAGGASFNGTSSKMYIPSGLPAGDISISIRFKASKGGASSRVLWDQDNAGGHSRKVVINTDDEFHFASRRSDGSTFIAARIPTADWTADTWHHVVGVQDGTTLRIYLDGVLKDETTYADIYTSFNADGYLGSRGSADYYDGLLDDVYVYSDVVTASEVETLDEGDYSDHTDNLVSAWPLDSDCNDAYGAHDGSCTDVTFVNSTADGYYNGMVVEITGGTGDGQSRLITDYDGARALASVAVDWDTTPDRTSEYAIHKAFYRFKESIDAGVGDNILVDGKDKILTVTKVKDLEAETDLVYRERTEDFVGSADEVGVPSVWWLEGNGIRFDVAVEDERWYEAHLRVLPEDVSTGTDVVQIPETFHEAVVLWAVWYGLLRDRDYTGAYATHRNLETFMDTTVTEYDLLFEEMDGGFEIYGYDYN